MMKIKIRGMAFDADRWITVKPNGADKKGSPVKIGENGEVKAGMGGKFNGQKISEVRKDFTGAKSPSAEHLEKSKEKQARAERLRNWKSSIKKDAPTETKQEPIEQAEPESKAEERPRSAMLKKMDKKLADLENKLNDLFDSSPAKGHGGTPNITDNSKGRANMRKMNDYHESIRKTMQEIEDQKDKISNMEYRESVRSRQTDKSKKFINKNPISEGLTKLEESGEVTAWKKNPHIFFIKGMDRVALITVDGKVGVSAKFMPKTEADKAKTRELIERANRGSQANDSIALDESVRHKDKNGHLIVKETVITKEDVNPYYGRDIPNHEELGLDPERIYYLYRPVEEIEKAVESFKGKQLLLKHKKVDSQNPEKDITIGAIGSDLKVKDGKLYGDMTFWDDEAIALIEARKHEQLSAGYGYDVQMTSGEHNGVEYDGVMTNLSGNHVALVKRGRIGDDAIICDEQTVGNTNMKFKKGSMPKIAAAIQMAFDSDLTEESVIEVANAVDEAREDEVAHDSNDLRGDLAKHFDEATVAKIMEVLGGADANDEQTQAERDNESEAMRLHDREERESFDRERDREEAHDADPEQLKREITERLTALFKAKDDVKELVGEVAMDSAEEVYKFALEQKGVSTKGVHPSAYHSMFNMLKGQSKKPVIAMDSAINTREGAKKIAPHIKL